MKITDHKTIAQIQEEFNELFPGLKIEFYVSQHDSKEGSPAADQLSTDLKIANVRSQHNEGDLVVDPSMTVAELEKGLASQFGLNVQIFRRSASIWLQTSATDHWTLEVQNRKGIHSTDFA
jgi:hypothetical protein